jgi:hypothetical protein
VELNVPQVVSSAVARVDYDDATATLYVTFRDSGSYAYRGVPRHVFDAFLASRSKGRFFARWIRGQYVQGEKLRWKRAEARGDAEPAAPAGGNAGNSGSVTSASSLQEPLPGILATAA